ncbi:hypothetical protein Pmani_015196 [Petrolisthes manimaculis]|uniref:Uncharacterized protein n=1 Tax=Petrolisthes manimaculis TaxID=1843537 RepID=A0AAE1UBV1_9EUCA|nr:hypothetical protein Pmani_015196 [Petrolisthes manimaculis]
MFVCPSACDADSEYDAGDGDDGVGDSVRRRLGEEARIREEANRLEGKGEMENIDEADEEEEQEGEEEEEEEEEEQGEWEEGEEEEEEEEVE